MYFIIMKFFVNTDAVLLQYLKIWVKPGQPMKTTLGTRVTRIPGMSDLDTFKPFSSNFQYFSSPVLVYNRDYCPVEPSKHHFINLFSHAFSIANNRHLRIRLPTEHTGKLLTKSFWLRYAIFRFLINSENYGKIINLSSFPNLNASISA